MFFKKNKKQVAILAVFVLFGVLVACSNEEESELNDSEEDNVVFEIKDVR